MRFGWLSPVTRPATLGPCSPSSVLRPNVYHGLDANGPHTSATDDLSTRSSARFVLRRSEFERLNGTLQQHSGGMLPGGRALSLPPFPWPAVSTLSAPGTTFTYVKSFLSESHSPSCPARLSRSVKLTFTRAGQGPHRPALHRASIFPPNPASEPSVSRRLWPLSARLLPCEQDLPCPSTAIALQL
jgi:hypothetical protein